MSTTTNTITSTLNTVIARVEAVFNEVLAFIANVAHVLRGDIVTHIVTPVESFAKTVVADVKADAAQIAKQV